MMFTQVCLKDPAHAVKLYLDISEKSKAESIIKLMTDAAGFSDCSILYAECQSIGWCVSLFEVF